MLCTIRPSVRTSLCNVDGRLTLLVEYCNRTATRLEQNRTEQKSRGAGNPENPLGTREFRQNRTQKEACNLTDKEEVPGSSPGRPTFKTP
jgi:hypothetical protein